MKKFRASEARRALTVPANTTACRVLFGEADGVPGLVITLPIVMPGSAIAAAPAWTLSLSHVT